jgi:AcrR family transcriptional regulator
MTAIPESKERVLAAADRLFMERGYKAVTLRDIAESLGIKHASLYYHAPGGKEQLYIEVTERNLRAHQSGLAQALAAASDNLHEALYGAAQWLITQPPMDLMRMTLSDLHEIAPAQAARLAILAQQSMLNPFRDVLDAAQTRGAIAPVDSGVIAGGLLSMLEGLHAVPELVFDLPHSAWFGKSRLDMARYLIDAFLRGLLPRCGSA